LPNIDISDPAAVDMLLPISKDLPDEIRMPVKKQEPKPNAAE
jgi:hypothetical protein